MELDYEGAGVYFEDNKPGGYLNSVEDRRQDTPVFIGPTAKGPIMDPVQVSSWPEYKNIFGNNDSSIMNASMDVYFRNGGKKAYVISLGACESEEEGEGFRAINPDLTKQYIKALDSLKKLDTVNLLVAPGLVDPHVQQAILDYCESKKTCFAILDCIPNSPVSGNSSVREQRKKLSTDRGYGALYYPWVRAKNQEGDEILLPPSGFIAGMLNRMDREGGVHKLPVGEPLVGAVGLERELSNGEQECLDSNNISTVRTMASKGVCLWSSGTLARIPKWRNMASRRLVMFLEATIARATEWVLFEPNNERTWARMKLMIIDYLTKYWRTGALIGDRASEAFYVICREYRDDTGQDDVKKGVLIEVGVATERKGVFNVFRIVHSWQGYQIFEV